MSDSKLNFIESGSGNKTVVFVHGNSQSAEYWDEVVAAMAHHSALRTIAIDLPGHGKSFRSSDPLSDYSLKGMATILTEFVNEKVQGPFIIVANSLGCNLVGEGIGNLKNCVGVFLNGSTAIGMGVGLQEIVKPNPNVGICFAADFTEEQLHALAVDAGFRLNSKSVEKIKKTFALTDPQFRVALANCVGKGEYSDELAAIKATGLPLAVVYGEHDSLCHTHCLNEIDLALWKSQVLMLKESGHCSHLDRPEELAKLICQFSENCFRK